MKRVLLAVALAFLPEVVYAGDLIYVLTSANEILLIDSSFPAELIAGRKVTGMAEGDRLLSIDVRPANGILYGISALNFFYRVDGATGAAVAIDVRAVDPLLTGTDVASDFDPVIDRMRVVDQAGTNIVVHPDLGRNVATQPSVAWAPGDPGEGATPAVVGLANSNSTIGATASITYVIDSGRNVLATMGRPTDGVTAPYGGKLYTIGPLGVDPSTVVGFDIAENGDAWALLFDGSVPKLYSLNLQTGLASAVGAISRGTAIDIAMAPSESVYVLPVAGRVAGGNNTLFRTDLRLLNRGATPVSVSLNYYPTGEGGNSGPSVSTSLVVAAGTEVVLDDLLKSTFSLDSGVGAVVVRSSRPIIVASRVYNDQRAVGGGTFGQFAPAFESTESRTGGAIPFIANRDAGSRVGYRTNIGWFNFTSTNVRLTLNAVSVAGVQLGKTSLTIHGLAHQQASLSQLFPGLAPEDDLFITFQVDGGSMFVYASVVDNVSGDAIFVPPY